ncbi:MAG: hypothetical protein KGQ58_02625 [Proteobacteria bacterium]|nr:hypothetical protein [Pseudomonadota bacterium]
MLLKSCKNGQALSARFYLVRRQERVRLLCGESLLPDKESVGLKIEAAYDAAACMNCRVRSHASGGLGG